MDLKSFNKKELSNTLYDQLWAYHTLNTRPNLPTHALRKFITFANKLFVENNHLYAKIKSKTLNSRSKKLEIIAPRDRDSKLKHLYKNVQTSRNGRDSFYFFVIQHYLNIPKSYVFDWLKKQVDYQLHVIQPKPKTVQPEKIKQVGEKIQVDIIDLSDLAGFNFQHRYVITMIDVFSKYAFARTMTERTKGVVANSIEDMLEEYKLVTGDYPLVIHTDNDPSFGTNEYNQIMKKRYIQVFFGQTYTPQQQGNIERFNKTIKNLIFAYITKRKTKNLTYSGRYINVLPDLIRNYNNSYHSSIKDTPAHVHNLSRKNLKQVKLVEKRINQHALHKKELPTLHVNDRVRLHILTNSAFRRDKTFAKKYTPQWIRQIYKVISRYNIDDPYRPSKYKVKMIFDENGQRVNDIINEDYYRHQLLLIPK